MRWRSNDNDDVENDYDNDDKNDYDDVSMVVMTLKIDDDENDCDELLLMVMTLRKRMMMMIRMIVMRC